MNKTCAFLLPLLLLGCAASKKEMARSVESERAIDDAIACVVNKCQALELSEYFHDARVADCLIRSVNRNNLHRVERMDSLVLGKGVPVAYFRWIDGCPNVEIAVSIVSTDEQIQRVVVSPVLD